MLYCIYFTGDVTLMRKMANSEFSPNRAKHKKNNIFLSDVVVVVVVFIVTIYLLVF